jgi:hypothetical protein
MLDTAALQTQPDLLPAFPDTARAWLHAPAQPLDEAQRETILAKLQRTVEHWKSHGTVVPAHAQFLDGSVLLVVADFTGAEASGCSIDRMVVAVREAGQAAGAELVDLLGVHAVIDGQLRFFDRKGFAQAVQAGQAGPDTLVYDLTLTQLGEVRQGLWKRPASQGWHGKAFRLASSAA